MSPNPGVIFGTHCLLNLLHDSGHFVSVMSSNIFSRFENFQCRPIPFVFTPHHNRFTCDYCTGFIEHTITAYVFCFIFVAVLYLCICCLCKCNVYYVLNSLFRLYPSLNICCASACEIVKACERTVLCGSHLAINGTCSRHPWTSRNPGRIAPTLDLAPTHASLHDSHKQCFTYFRIPLHILQIT